MLVVSRKQGEEVCIGESIFVRILEVRGGRAKIAIEAPDRVLIRRAELLERADASKNIRASDK
ncbi:MAG: carbon storage regulator [Pirellulales bacterium]|nr:carbon storage regulator [Pirellulales bacterium]